MPECCKLIDDVLDSSAKRFSRVPKDLVNTKANLNFDVLRDICLVCSVPVERFEGKETFVDKILLKRRNAIAHGEETLISFEDLDEVTNETIALMRSFGDELENQINLQTYRLP
jgi:hypothetical protein